MSLNLTGTDATIIVAILSLSGAIGGSIIQYVSSKWQGRDSERKNDRDDFSVITTSLRAELAEEKREKRSLEKKVESLLVRVSVLEGKMAAAPFPEWMVGLDGSYLWVNTAFESRWLRSRGIDRTSVVGMRHTDVFSAGVASVLESIDSIARSKSNYTARRDDITIESDPASWLIIKWGIRDLQTGALIGFHGAAIPSDF